MDNSSFSNSSLNRRKFIINSVKTASVLSLSSPLATENILSIKKQLTVQEIIRLILKEGELPIQKLTVDTIKSGNADQVVTGIVTTMFPTVSVIEEAAKRNANFIIAHEPTFYNHRDDTEWVKNNSVVKQKQQLLEKHKMVVWRFHDYCHALTPDAISYGVAKKANWLPYFKTGETILTLPSQSLRQLVQHLKTSLGITHVKAIGNPDQVCKRVALLPGAWGGQRHVSIAEAEKPDVLIVGEVSEWETAEYIRDARLLGSNIALIVLGHAVSEEPGMEWFVDWLQPKIADVKVTHLASKDPFLWL